MNIDNTFMQKYIEQVVLELLLVFPEKNKEELTKYVEEKLSNLENVEAYSITEKDKIGNENPTTILEQLNYIEDKKPIITGFGTLYEQHENMNNILLDMVQMLLDIRKVYKKKKLAHLNDEDKTLCNLYDKYQLVYKLLNNSFFGATGQPQSIFFDPYFPSSIMNNGQIIIMTAITTFEKIVGNFYFDSIDDVLLYVKRIKEQKYTRTINIDKDITKEELFNLIKSKFENKKFEENILKKLISNLSQDEINKIYYKNNLIEFMKLTEVKKILKDVITDKFLDPNEPPEEIKDKLNEYWNLVKEYCMYVYIPVNRTQFCHHHIRKTVLVVDTDSNFLYNKPITDNLRLLFPEELKEYDKNQAIKLSCISISMYIYSKLIAEGYDYMGRVMNIDDKHRPVINMKNE